MFSLIHEMLQIDEFYGKSKNIDIAKGVNVYPRTITEALKQGKRKIMVK